MAGRKIQYVQQETPSFIKNFKAQVGYKEPDNVESKFEKLEKSSNEEEEDRDGEKPVVILGSNVSEQEANEFLAKEREEEEEEEDEESEEQDHEAKRSSKVENKDNKQEGKFVFKKPTKRKSEESRKDDRKKQKEKQKSSSKAVKNASLLSFGDDEEEED
ncbi:cilia- and flagella-associated protein 251-like [Actinia tenebrosa]|uniref:Cilia- and flagella-associated protein 251-like n=1 Tax=Actinia tenebrosa TaxID=6105 RepID=A0A6P8HY72_ACTTE|nr:cilia- and flagella-associated protein 251-like [Actinia tenebrosa]